MQNSSLSNVGIKGRFKQFGILVAIILIGVVIAKVIEAKSDKTKTDVVQSN